MNEFEIVTDSTCDLPLDWLSEHGVTVVPLYVFFGDEVFRDQVEITSERFYDRMLASEELPHSSQPAPDEFLSCYRSLAERGARRVLSLHISEALSGTVNSATIAAGMATDVPVTVYDTRNAAVTHGMMVREAVAMRDAGETLEATVAHLDEVRAHIRLLAVPDTLDNLVKNGRLSRFAGRAVGVLDIKLELTLDTTGHLVPVHRARGTGRALRGIVSSIGDLVAPGERLLVSLLTTRNERGCQRLLGMIEAAGYPVELLGTYSAGPVIATHAGMGLIALGVMPARVSYHAR